MSSKNIMSSIALMVILLSTDLPLFCSTVPAKVHRATGRIVEFSEMEKIYNQLSDLTKKLEAVQWKLALVDANTAKIEELGKQVVELEKKFIRLEQKTQAMEQSLKEGSEKAAEAQLQLGKLLEGQDTQAAMLSKILSKLNALGK